MAAKSGFAIRCPFCGNWSVWRTIDLWTLVVRSADEGREILLSQHRGGPEAGPHPKLLRCTSPRWICPSSYEALIFEDRSIALLVLRDIGQARARARMIGTVTYFSPSHLSFSLFFGSSPAFSVGCPIRESCLCRTFTVPQQKSLLI
jgi:hypothetical protein